MIALVAALAAPVLLLATILGWQMRASAGLKSPGGGRRILLPFTDSIDETVLNAAIRIARAEDATLVPANLLVVPLEYAEDSTLSDQVTVAMPLLEAVENVPLCARVAVDARIEKGTQSHSRAPSTLADRQVRSHRRSNSGQQWRWFQPENLTWILTHSPSETLVLKLRPAEPESVEGATTTDRCRSEAA